MRLKLIPVWMNAIGAVHDFVYTEHLRDPGGRGTYTDTCESPAQRLVRDNFATVDRTWQTLSRPEKDAWNRWRYWYDMWGYNVFMRVNLPRGLHGLPLQLSPPAQAPW